jgi:lysozyme family protein
MEQRFLQAFDTLIEHEGGFINDPVDAGGATNYGISLRFYQLIKPDATKQDIENLELEDAKEIYYNQWWTKYNYDNIKHFGLAEKLLDFSVNMGPSQAHILLQKAVNAFCGYNRLAVDGLIGPNTISACNSITDKNHHMSEENAKGLINYFVLLACAFYLELTEQEPENYRFLKGWINRATDNTQLADVDLHKYN